MKRIANKYTCIIYHLVLISIEVLQVDETDLKNTNIKKNMLLTHIFFLSPNNLIQIAFRFVTK